MIRTIKERVGRIPPSKLFTVLLLLSKACRHIVTALLIVFFSLRSDEAIVIIPYALLPLVCMDVLALQEVLPRYVGCFSMMPGAGQTG
jgi:hypothetical protein